MGELFCPNPGGGTTFVSELLLIFFCIVDRASWVIHIENRGNQWQRLSLGFVLSLLYWGAPWVITLSASSKKNLKTIKFPPSPPPLCKVVLSPHHIISMEEFLDLYSEGSAQFSLQAKMCLITIYWYWWEIKPDWNGHFSKKMLNKHILISLPDRSVSGISIGWI